MAAKESPKAMEAIKKEPEEPVADNDKLKVSAMKIASVAWEFKGTIVVSGLTIACIIGSHKLSMKEIAALTATCGYLATNRDKLETEIRKLPGGEEALKAVKKEVMEKRQKRLSKKISVFPTNHGAISQLRRQVTEICYALKAGRDGYLGHRLTQ